MQEDFSLRAARRHAMRSVARESKAGCSGTFAPCPGFGLVAIECVIEPFVGRVWA